MKITDIQFTNYKAFYGNDPANKIQIPNGKNLLIYGENGSGKTSIYEGLRNLFLASNPVNSNANFSRHIAVDKYITDPDDSTSQIQQPANIKITLNDFKGTVREVIYGNPHQNVENDIDILDASKSNNFLSYRELLKTYLVPDVNDEDAFRKALAELIINDILANSNNPVTNKSYIHTNNELRTRGRGTKPSHAEKVAIAANFDIGFKRDINDINTILNELLYYFFPELKVELSVQDTQIVYDTHNHPEFRVDLKCTHYGLDTNVNGETHLSILNEAKLSALALCIFLSGIIIKHRENTKIKFLFLDDIFIGLDTSNRIPLLQILNEFKKVEWSETINPTSGKLENFIQKNENGSIKYKSKPFFDEYQIFITTYDRHWFEIAKGFFESKTEGKWHHLELYSNPSVEHHFNTPAIYESLDYLKRANLHFLKNDYPACSNYLRKALEKRLKELLPPNKQYVEYVDRETGLKEIKKIKSLGQYIDIFVSYCKEIEIDIAEIKDLKNLKDWYLNPFSHDNISSPLYRKEIEAAMLLVKKLYSFKINLLAEVGTNLYFKFEKEDGQTREFKISLTENLRSIESEGSQFLVDPKVNCYRWINNDIPNEVNWPCKLFSLYKKNLKDFDKTANIENLNYSELIFFEADNLPLNSKMV